MQTLDGRRVQAVAVLQAVRDEVHDLPAQEFEGAAENHRGRDPVDVVVAVHRDALASRHGPEQPLHGDAHAGQEHGVVQVVEARVQEAVGRLGIVDAAQDQQAGDGRLDAGGAGQGVGRRIVTGLVLPAVGHHQREREARPAGFATAATAAESVKSTPRRPIWRSFV